MSQGERLETRKEIANRIICNGPMLKSQYEKFSPENIYDAEIKNLLGNWELTNISIFGDPEKEGNLEGTVKITAHFGINGYFPKLGDRMEESREQYDFFVSWKGEPERDENGWHGYYDFSPLLSKQFHSNSLINEFVGEHIYQGIKETREKIRNPHGLAF